MGFKVIIAKNNLHFAASHFITFGGKCEFLHGHNYAVSLELAGPLTADSYVFDFVTLKRIGRAIAETLDHRFLLATCNPHLKTRHSDRQWEIDYKTSHYVFPEKDVNPLPIDNVTAERLAEYIWNKIAPQIAAHGASPQCILTVGVEEAEGQAAFYTQPLFGLVDADVVDCAGVKEEATCAEEASGAANG